MALPTTTAPAEGPALTLEERIDLEAFTLFQKNNPKLLAALEDALKKGATDAGIQRVLVAAKAPPLTAALAMCAVGFLRREAQRKAVKQ